MLERTLAIIKPDVFPQHAGAIITMATEAGLVPVEARVLNMATGTVERTKNDAGRVGWAAFYGEHASKHFFESMISFMASGPVLVLVLEGDHAISHWRELMGSTDSRKARLDTVRGRFGAPAHFLSTKNTGRAPGEVGEYPMWRNAVHGSDSPEAAAREIAFFFGH